MYTKGVQKLWQTWVDGVYEIFRPKTEWPDSCMDILTTLMVGDGWTKKELEKFQQMFTKKSGRLIVADVPHYRIWQKLEDAWDTEAKKKILVSEYEAIGDIPRRECLREFILSVEVGYQISVVAVDGEDAENTFQDDGDVEDVLEGECGEILSYKVERC